ncbi:Glutamate-gated chloride channel [Lamellibrachia satsuma]|nr:Glutamate-gated chloride channel [Lamellibrachia satsuma]
MSQHLLGGVTLLLGILRLLYVDCETTGATVQERLSEFTRLQALLQSPQYSNEIRPESWIARPTIVDLSIYIISLGPIDQVKMEYTVDLFLRQRWFDPRLTHRIPLPITVSYRMYEYMWVPDTYIINEKHAVFHEMTVPNILIKVFPNGSIFYSRRVTLRLGCDMKLAKFPLDNQTCRISFQSYSHTTRDVIFRWHYPDPIEKVDSGTLSEFTFVEYKVGNCTRLYSVEGQYTCVFGQLMLDRQFNYYVVQTYVPTVLIVILSWVSFWIDETAVPARVTLGILTVLTMTSQSTVINQRLPRVSYIKAIDVWMSSCLMFVFGALIEFSIVNVMTRESMLVQKAEELRHEFLDDDEESASLDVSEFDMKLDRSASNNQPISFVIEQPLIDLSIPDLERVETDRDTHNKCCGRINYCNRHPAATMDIVSRVLFPLLFLVFNIIYWNVYLKN